MNHYIFQCPEIALQITTAQQEIMTGKGQLRDAAILLIEITSMLIVNTSNEQFFR